jgi:hypothetical protein
MFFSVEGLGYKEVKSFLKEEHEVKKLGKRRDDETRRKRYEP